MSKPNLFSEAIIHRIKSAEEAKIIQPVQVGKTDQQNELVFFIKPELLDVAEKSKILSSLQLIQKKFTEFKVEINGAAIIPGAVLDEFEIMNRHYGYINQLSRMASEMIDEETRERMFEKLEIKDQGEHRVLGGHEFLKAFNTDIDALSEVWFAQEANKLRSGFYFIEDTFQNEPIVLVNGFHPSQLEHFTREDHRIVLMLLHTDTDWYDMKFNLVGDTFPERAKPGSIRGMLYADPDRFGQEHVGINTNGVHLSAGPFEAAFEVVNFFGNLLELDPALTPPLAIQRVIDASIPKTKALSLLENPPMNDSDLFSETENLNTDIAVKLAKDRLANKK
jgi:hypothetical protein